MDEEKYLFRAPLLDAKQRVVGYRFGWQQVAGAPIDTAFDNQRLLALMASELSAFESGRYFVDVCATSVLSAELQTMVPANFTLIFGLELLQNSALADRLFDLQKHGFGLALRGADLTFVSQNKHLIIGIDTFLVALEDPQFDEITVLLGLQHPAIAVVVLQVPGWTEFEICANKNYPAFFEDLCLAPRTKQTSGKFNSGSQQIFRLMEMVRENADIREIEKVLQSDAMLSYKLLRYINSAGFGLRVEVESLRQAVALLGYTPFFRWLTLMLARTNSDGFSPALMQVSIVRGRFAELLAQDFFTAAESENLFVVGMFSRLDQLLGLPMEEVLKQIVLPAPVNQALVTRDGPYGPFLALAEAGERHCGESANLAAPLLISSARTNKAHLSALVWAKNLEL
jgi:EAL and modified HD-GYP domain-containing signal transduction protein